MSFPENEEQIPQWSKNEFSWEYETSFSGNVEQVSLRIRKQFSLQIPNEFHCQTSFSKGLK